MQTIHTFIQKVKRNCKLASLLGMKEEEKADSKTSTFKEKKTSTSGPIISCKGWTTQWKQ